MTNPAASLNYCTCILDFSHFLHFLYGKGVFTDFVKWDLTDFAGEDYAGAAFLAHFHIFSTILSALETALFTVPSGSFLHLFLAFCISLKIFRIYILWTFYLYTCVGYFCHCILNYFNNYCFSHVLILNYLMYFNYSMYKLYLCMPKMF